MELNPAYQRSRSEVQMARSMIFGLQSACSRVFGRLQRRPDESAETATISSGLCLCPWHLIRPPCCQKAYVRADQFIGGGSLQVCSGLTERTVCSIAIVNSCRLDVAWPIQISKMKVPKGPRSRRATIPTHRFGSSSKMGLLCESDNLPRIAGRLFGLLILEDEAFSLRELADRLQVSRASVSTNARILTEMGLAERSPAQAIVRTTTGSRAPFRANSYWQGPGPQKGAGSLCRGG